MKNLVLVFNASAQQSVTDQLRELDVAGFTVTQVQGHGPHTDEDPFLSSRDRVVGFVPRVRVDIVLPSEQITAVLHALHGAKSGLAGHGVYWVLPVESFERF